MALEVVSRQRDSAEELVTWPLTRLAAIVREFFLQGFVFPLFHLFWRADVFGCEHVANLQGPVIIAANHHFLVRPGYGGEYPAIWMALPRHLRLRVCTAADTATFAGALKGAIARLCLAFPLPKQGGVRSALARVGRLLDLGWSVLIFPEGNGFDGGPLRPFKGGTGLIAVDVPTPVVPVWVQVYQRSMVQHPPGRGRGAYSVRFGKPLVFAPGTNPSEATKQIEAAVQALAPLGVLT
jgi:long-chain acyl-CoA synthetase